MLYRAYHTMQREMSASGIPVYVTRSTDPEIGWRVDDAVDASERVIQEYDAEKQKQKNPPKGVSRWAVPIGLDGKELETSGLERERLLKGIAQAKVEVEENSPTADLLEQGLIEMRPPGGYDMSEYGDGLVDSGQD